MSALTCSVHRFSRREVADVCGTLLDAPLCTGSVDGLCRTTADALAIPVAERATMLPTAPVANAGETG